MNELTDREEEILEIITDETKTFFEMINKTIELLQPEEIKLPGVGLPYIFTHKKDPKLIHIGFVTDREDLTIHLHVSKYNHCQRFKIVNYTEYTWKYPQLREYKYKNEDELYKVLPVYISSVISNLESEEITELLEYARETTNEPDWEKEYSKMKKPVIEEEMITYNYTIKHDMKYPFNLMLATLIEASDILLHKLDYDGDRWELLHYNHLAAESVEIEMLPNESKQDYEKELIVGMPCLMRDMSHQPWRGVYYYGIDSSTLKYKSCEGDYLQAIPFTRDLISKVEL